MPDGTDPIAVKVLSGLAGIDASQWDACAGEDNPFIRHGFLSALEESGSVQAKTGWMPQHLVIEDPDGTLAACVPLYLKSHSYGEYVFDWGWAEAYERAGGRYYPKLQCCVPFTPVTGPRLLVRRGLAETRHAQLADALTAALMQMTERAGASSAHVTFPERGEWERLGGHGWLKRIGLQFHWPNREYAHFDDFLATLSSRKRKALRKERAQVADSGLAITTLVGDDIKERHWDAFHRFYLDTVDKKWGQNYLSRDFFPLMAERMGDAVVLVWVERDGEPVAGALNLRGADTLYGRNWGCVEDHKFLHFETCYYRAIDFAIETGLTWVEAGAQGPHKVQRGYLPRQTQSAHWIRDPGLSDAVADFLVRETRAVRHEMAAFDQMSPYKKGD